MSRLLFASLLALTIALAPLAAADETSEKPSTNETDPEDKAWVDDCPEGQMCAYGAEDCIECSGPAPDEPTHSGDCGGEVCAYDTPSEGETPETRGPEDCEYCRGGGDEPVDDLSGGAPDGASNCMDGEQEGEVCRDDVQYMVPPKSGDDVPEGAVAKGDDDSAQSDAQKTVPGPGLAVAVLGVAAAGLVVLARKD